jgi:hypothetical protein
MWLRSKAYKLWEMQWSAFLNANDGKNRDALLARIEAGHAVPSYDNQPDYPDGLEWVLSAFSQLSTDRPVTMGGEGPIPFTSIDRYAKRYDVAEFDEFLTYIRALDAAYLEHAHRKV